jgi:MFS family permease
MTQPNQVMESMRRESYWSLMLASLHYRNFRLVWLGSFSEHFGEFMEIAAVLWLTNELTHSPLMLTIVGSARFMAMILFPIAGGVVADRVNRRSLLIIALLSSASLSVVLAILAFTGVIAVWHLIVIGLFGGVATSFNHPARQTIVPNLVRKEHLLNAMSLDFISVQVSRMIGMSLAGYLIAVVGVWPIFVLRALGCLLAVFWLLLARVPPTPPTARGQAPWRNLAEGFRYLRANTIMLGLVVLYLIPWLTMNTYTNFLPVFADDILHIGAVGYGYLQAAPGLGAIFALIGLTLLTYYKRKTLLLFVSGAMMGIGLITFSASPWVFLSLPLLVLIGGMVTAFNVVNTTIIQGVVPDEVRGRVMSWREVAFGLGPTGSILFGLIAQYSGVPISLGLLGGVCLILSLLLIAFLPRFRSIE